jgi:hypothetical protein
MRPSLPPIAAALLLLLGLACGSSPGPGESDALPSDASPSTAGLPERPDLEPLVEGPVSPDGLRAVLGTGDLGIGTHRVGFVLTSPQGFVTTPALEVSSRYLGPGSDGEAAETATAEFHAWPYAGRGLYTTQLTFDRAGSWAIDIAVERPDGSVQTAELPFQVAEATSAPAVGSPAVESVNRIIRDVDTLAELSTGSLQDPDLYQITIADAVTGGMPTVVVMASPAFCANAVCGPQVEVLQELKNAYSGLANFIHVDFYDNPHEIQGNLETARLSPTVREWRLASIEWTYVIDADGIVSARFEAFATFAEVEKALLQLL